MGHGFGQLYKLRGIVMYRISHFEQKLFTGIISHGFPNTIRRIAENFPYIAPPVALCYLSYDQLEKEHHRLMLKNPADFENDQ
ncbi:unnamed protein product [Phaedon cochleariae]|uniref:Cytochrome b-c1 complex subunit 8 n=1 Tax=Phaedon cochleariae TaxID=80249 RepID=A0A9N9SEM0_PHACE|nr:unnamed protein product [Phaedon cochleariae]